MAIDDLGSGSIMSKSGENLTYTQVKEYDYANDEADLCFLWNPNSPFSPGSYNVEIYNKGDLELLDISLEENDPINLVKSKRE